ncbi:MAG: hypothetical protein AAFV07_18815 [Bacteroidota bacterium]
MNPTPDSGRRDFLKLTPLVAGVVMTGTLTACATRTEMALPEDQDIMFIPPDKWMANEHKAAGLLYSQVGYEPGFPVRLLIRMPDKSLLSDQATCHLKPTPDSKGKEASAPVSYWGALWQNHWWEIEFADLPEGEWWIEVQDKGQLLWRQPGLVVRQGILWDETAEWGTADMLERRFHFTGVGAGWQDAGAKWVESPAQSAMVMALVDVMRLSADRLPPGLQDRILHQIKVGADYLF